MAKMVIGDFSSESTARAAIAALNVADVATGRIGTYPTLAMHAVSAPKPGESVKGAETPMSKEGPLGHLAAVIAKVFHADDHNEALAGGSEPTRELTDKTPVFLSVHIENDESAENIESILMGAGASRVAHHDE